MEELKIEPRLRLEPSLTYYLRTARAYAFLVNFLGEAVGADTLKSLHGLTRDGERPKDLDTDLRDIRDLFYGFYLLGSEDIGLAPEFLDGEEVDQARAKTLAAEWLASPLDSPDLAVDTRVAVPITYDPTRNVTRLWVTLGVRLDRLDVFFARPPSVKPSEGEGDWKLCEPFMLVDRTYLVPVDEFVEVELPGSRVLTRDELRAVCDEHKSKAAIVKALQTP